MHSLTSVNEMLKLEVERRHNYLTSSTLWLRPRHKRMWTTMKVMIRTERRVRDEEKRGRVRERELV